MNVYLYNKLRNSLFSKLKKKFIADQQEKLDSTVVSEYFSKELEKTNIVSQVSCHFLFFFKFFFYTSFLMQKRGRRNNTKACRIKCDVTLVDL